MLSCDVFTCPFALDLQNEIQLLSTFFGILGWLFIGLWLRNAPLDKKKSEIIAFKNKLLLVSLILFTLLDYAKSLNYWMGFRAACRSVSLSNYIAFDVFFLSGFMFMPSFFRIFVRFETINLT